MKYRTNINDFKQNLINFLRPNRFTISSNIFEKEFETFKFEDTERNSLFTSIKSINIPSFGIDTIPIKFFGNNSIFDGDMIQPQNITMNFHNSMNGKIYKYFTEWIYNIYNIENSTHKTDYDINFCIYMINDSNEIDDKYSFEIFNAFPIDINGIELNYDSESMISEFNVQFALTHFSNPPQNTYVPLGLSTDNG